MGNKIIFDNPILMYSDPAESIEIVSTDGFLVDLNYIEYGNHYKTETKKIEILPPNIQNKIREKIKNLVA